MWWWEADRGAARHDLAARLQSPHPRGIVICCPPPGDDLASCPVAGCGAFGALTLISQKENARLKGEATGNIESLPMKAHFCDSASAWILLKRILLSRVLEESCGLPGQIRSQSWFHAGVFLSSGDGPRSLILALPSDRLPVRWQQSSAWAPLVADDQLLASWSPGQQCSGPLVHSQPDSVVLPAAGCPQPREDPRRFAGIGLRQVLGRLARTPGSQART